MSESPHSMFAQSQGSVQGGALPTLSQQGAAQTPSLVQGSTPPTAS